MEDLTAGVVMLVAKWLIASLKAVELRRAREYGDDGKGCEESRL